MSNEYFLEITKEEFEKHFSLSVGEYEDEKKNYWWTNGITDVIIPKEGMTIYLRDCTDFKYYRCPKILPDILSSYLYGLNAYGLHIREGFVDKSFNTELFSPLIKFTFLIGPLYFKMNEIMEISKKIQNTYNK